MKVVVRNAPKKLTLTAEIERGESTRLRVTLPKNTAGGCAYSADDSGVLRVSPDGVVTALDYGAGAVTATAYNGVSASGPIPAS